MIYNNKSICKKHKIILAVGIFAVGFFAFFARGASAAPVYYSVGQNTTSHETGAGNVTISGTTATFTVAQTATNMGVGDVIDYDTDHKLCYISAKTSTTVWSCTNATGGTPTAASNVVVNSISHVFASLNLAEAGSATLLGNSDLTAIDVQLNISCYYDSGADNTAVTIEGWTTDATRYIKIYTPSNTTTEVNQSQRHNGKWDDTKYRINVVTANSINFREDFIRIEGLQIDQGNYNGAALGWNGANLNNGAEYFISSTIFKGDSSYAGGQYAILLGTGPTINVKVSNCVFYNYEKTNSATRVIFNNAATNNLYLHNITVQGGYYAVRGNANTFCKNCVSIGAVNGFDGLSDADSRNSSNASDVSDTDAPGGNKVLIHLQSEGATITDWFNSTTDFHLNSAAYYSWELRNMGSDLSADANFTVTTDIDGQTRPIAGIFDIGADEGETAVFYSVGQSSSDLKVASTATISSNVATFATAQTGNIGVGDRITYGQIDISSFADQGGGVVRITTSTNHGFSTGDYVSITGTTNYNGNYQIANAAGSVFDITHTYTAEAGGATKYTANIAFIASKTSTTVWTLTGLKGAAISNRASATTINSITREYTSLSLAEAGAIDANHLNASDLYTNNLQLNFPCYYDTGADTTAVTVDGYTTNATNYIKIYTPSNTSTEANNSQRHQGKWDDAKYKRETNSLEGSGLTINISNIIIDGIQAKISGIYGSPTISTGALQQKNVTVSNNILKNEDTGNTGGGIGNFTDNYGDIRIYNNIISDFPDYGIRVINSNRGNSYVYNNTIINCGTGIRDWYNDIIAKNNMVQNCADGYSVDFNSASDYNLSDLAADAPGANSKNSATVLFADKVGKDFHLAINDTAARNAGTSLSADSSFAFSTDIDGHSRPALGTWDIGADEGATAVYYSVGQNTNDHSIGNGGATCSTTGSCTVTITSGTATFNYAQTATNLGVGDKVTYNTTSIAYISQKISTTQWKLVTATGATPADVTGQTVNSITHAFLSLTQAIGNGNNGAGDSSHLNTSNLKTNNYQLNIPCYYDTGANASSLTMATGYVTALPNYIKIYTPKNTSTEVNVTQRHQGKWDDAKFRVDYNSSFSLNIAYTIVDGLQFNIGSGGVVMYAGAERAIVSNSIIRSSYGANYGIQVERRYSKEAFVYNNIIYGVANGIARYYDGAGGTLYAYNNTVYGCTTAAIRDMQGSSVVAKNNIVQSSTDGYTGTFLSSSDNNISDLASDAPGTNPHNSATVSFADAANYDFHLSSPDTAAKGAGVNLQQDSYLHFSQDIDGHERTGTWDIGADEFDAGTVGSPDIGADTVENGLVGYWSFNGDDISGTTAYDRSGNDNNGTITSVTAVEGKLGQGMDFDSAGNVVSVTHDTELDGMANLSFGAWIYPRSSGVGNNYGRIIEKGTENPYNMEMYGNNIICGVNGVLAESTTNPIHFNEWQYVACTYDGSTVTVYANGSAYDTASLSGSVNAMSWVDLYFGNNSTGDRTFNGKIDEVRIYNRALSADEVGRLYRAGQVKIAASQNSRSTSGLVGLWSFDGPDVSGTTAYDRSGSGNNGTITGATPTIGKLGQALEFNGTSNRILINDSSSLALSRYTVSAWVNVSQDLSSTRRVFERRCTSCSSRANYILSVYNNGTADFGHYGTALNFVRGSTDLRGIGWAHIAGTYDGSYVRVYINGVEEDSDPAQDPYTTGTHQINISYDPIDLGAWFDGRIDDIRVYSRALSTEEIANLYYAGSVQIKK